MDTESQTRLLDHDYTANTNIADNLNSDDEEDLTVVTTKTKYFINWEHVRYFLVMLLPISIISVIFRFTVYNEMIYKLRFIRTNCYLEYVDPTPSDDICMNQCNMPNVTDTCYYNTVDNNMGSQFLPLTTAALVFMIIVQLFGVIVCMYGMNKIDCKINVLKLTFILYIVVTIVFNVVMYFVYPYVEFDEYALIYAILLFIKNIVLPFNMASVNSLKYCFTTMITFSFILILVYCWKYQALASPFSFDNIYLAGTISEVGFVLLCLKKN